MKNAFLETANLYDPQMFLKCLNEIFYLIATRVVASIHTLNDIYKTLLLTYYTSC